MSGEFTTGYTPATDAADATHQIDTQEGGYETDVPEIKAPAIKNGLPVFDIPEDEFYTNLKNDRKRLQVKDPDSTLSKYLKQSQYNRPFWLRTADNKLMRKVKG